MKKYTFLLLIATLFLSGCVGYPYYDAEVGYHGGYHDRGYRDDGYYGRPGHQYPRHGRYDRRYDRRGRYEHRGYRTGYGRRHHGY